MTGSSEVERKIPFKEIRPDMVLSRDVIVRNGTVLFAAGTMLNDVNFLKLKAYHVAHVFVRAASINESLPFFSDGDTAVPRREVEPIKERKDFQEFEQAYEEKSKEVESVVRAISDGASINLGELQKITGGILSKLRCKSDVMTFISTLETTSDHTFSHCTNVSLLCNLFGYWIGLDEQRLRDLTAAGMLHDIGKIQTPPNILNKQGKLTKEEYEVIKQHAADGYRILKEHDIPEDIKMAVLLHHEKTDGTGYPFGIKGDKINKMAQMVAIVDIYDAMTTNRVYRNKICPFTVIKTFERKFYGELDTELLLAFLKNIAYTYIGTWVRLSDNRAAEVVFINQQSLSNPMVRFEDGEILDLMTRQDISVAELL